MGKVFSCLPFKKRDSCTGNLPRKKPTGPENEKRGHTRNVREKEQAEPERHPADGHHPDKSSPLDFLAAKTCRDVGHWTLEDVEQEDGQTVCGDEVVPARRTKQGYGVWRLEDIEQEQSNRDTSTSSETKACSLSSKSQKHSTDTTSSSPTGDCGRADVTISPSDPAEVDDRPMTPWTRVEDKPSPRKGAKGSDSTPVSLRQTREDYTRRLTRQRSMTRALLESRSPSPYHRRQMTTSVGKAAVDTDNSQGDTIQKDTHTSKYSKDLAVKDDPGINGPHSAKDVQRLDATSSDTTSGVPNDNMLSSKETGHVISADGLKQIEHDFVEEFQTASGDVVLTPVPSFLKITGDGDMPAILKEEKLRHLEEAFYQEFPVEDIKVETIPCSLDACKEEIIGINATCDFGLSLEGETSHDVNDDVNAIKVIEDTCSIRDENTVERSIYSSEDTMSEQVCDGFLATADDTVCVKINDSTDEIVAILQLAKEFSEQRNLSRKKKLQLLKEYKTHDLRTILENTVGERKAESRDVCLNIIDICLDKLVPDTSADHWCSKPDIDVINPDDDDDSETFDEDESAADDRMVKLVTLFENTIEEEREECEDFCFSLVLRLVDAIDYGIRDSEHNHMCDRLNSSETSVNNCEESDALNNTSNYHACIRRIRSDTDVIIAVDVNGTGHPILVGIGSVIAIDRDGIGHTLNSAR